MLGGTSSSVSSRPTLGCLLRILAKTAVRGEDTSLALKKESRLEMVFKALSPGEVIVVGSVVSETMTVIRKLSASSNEGGRLVRR